jgi:beta-fructofuranosidase
MIMGSGLRGVGGCALLYRSPDLRQWEYMHPLCVGDVQPQTPVWTGSMWECPDFFAFAERHVLTVAVWDNNTLYYSAAMSGHYDGAVFVVEQVTKLDHGGNTFYAPQSFRDGRGRRIMFGWLQESCSGEAQRARGWSGVMSLPRELHLLSDGSVYAAPIAELAMLRGEPRRVAAQALPTGAPVLLDAVRGDALEIVAELRPQAGGSVGIALRRAANGSEETRLSYDSQRQQLTLDRSRASLDATTDRAPHSTPLVLGDHEPLKLHIFLDRSVVEIFANDRLSMSSRIYPTRADSLGVAVFAEREAGELLSLEAWPMSLQKGYTG